MAEEKKTYEDMSNPEKIDAKKRKIKKLFRDLPTEKKQFAEGLINQFAVTSVTLERLADAINNGDLIEDFVQGAQKMRRESPALRAYNTTIKSFSTLTNQLISLLPEKEKKTAGDELMQFITKPKAAGILGADFKRRDRHKPPRQSCLRAADAGNGRALG